ncbi:MAG: acetyl-CoA carboxylase biotin carboxyl carrier protein [Chlorobiaceae bacterium]|jgi:acetyl-CoA carboxylase biotin carboxyl carrier protein|nr:acetyl-CoA carboxylase biotin carboxyl carrier protein [Chlorobiaceae bacterium]NTV17407.1 acetyl-CoA carboxylase biotin carboxyl carrier protein [Chlorobiaceae bacterium]
MDFNEIRQLIDIVNSSDLQETIIEKGDFKIILRRSAATVAPTLVPVTAAPALQASPQASNAAPAATKSEPVSNLIESRSPIVGTFYQSSSPDSPPFVSVNDTVKKGDVLCIIEAMKLMNEIEAEVSGTIVEILVENGQAIEYDQPLFRIKP